MNKTKLRQQQHLIIHFVCLFKFELWILEIGLVVPVQWPIAPNLEDPEEEQVKCQMLLSEHCWTIEEIAQFLGSIWKEIGHLNIFLFQIIFLSIDIPIHRGKFRNLNLLVPNFRKNSLCWDFLQNLNRNYWILLNS